MIHGMKLLTHLHTLLHNTQLKLSKMQFHGNLAYEPVFGEIHIKKVTQGIKTSKCKNKVLECW